MLKFFYLLYFLSPPLLVLISSFGGCKLGLRNQTIPYPYQSRATVVLSLSFVPRPSSFSKYTFVSISLLCVLVCVPFSVLVFPRHNPTGFQGSDLWRG